MLLTRMRPLALALLASLAVAWLATEVSRPSYVIDGSGARPVSRNGALIFTLASLVGLGIGTAIVVVRERRRRPVRAERDLAGALGPALLATRPARDGGLRELACQLLVHWLVEGRSLLPVVSAEGGRGTPRIAADLAAIFSGMGVRTLLIDGDLRWPAVHADFRIDNRRGLADLLEERPVQPSVCGEHLAVLPAGSPRQDPLQLLSRPLLREFLAAASKRFRVVLVATPAAAEGPDLEIFAALAGGALVVHEKDADQGGLVRLSKHLEKARARVVSVVVTG